VETLHSVLKHGAMFSDWDAFPRDVFRDRLAATKRAMRDCGDDAWIIYGDAQNYGELAYVTHFLPRLRSSLVLITPDAEPVVLTCVGSRDIPAMQVLTWITDIRPYWRLPDDLGTFLTDAGLANARLGLVGARESMPIGEWDAIRRNLPGVQWTFRDDEFAEIRKPDDVTARAVKHAVAVVDEGLRAAAATFRNQPTSFAAAAEIERAVRRLAAEDVRILIGGSSPSGPQLRPPDDVPIVANGSVPIVLAVEVQRCWAEGAITIPGTTQRPGDRILAEMAERSLAAMVAVVKPQTRAADVWEAGMRAIDRPELRDCANGYGLGHGIGLDANEAPDIAEGGAGSFAACAGVALHVVLQHEHDAAVAATTLVRAGNGFAG
jgi:Xaa-Pro aminopeptidase